jgi:hypothetical protein
MCIGGDCLAIDSILMALKHATYTFYFYELRNLTRRRSIGPIFGIGNWRSQSFTTSAAKSGHFTDAIFRDFKHVATGPGLPDGTFSNQKFQFG